MGKLSERHAIDLLRESVAMTATAMAERQAGLNWLDSQWGEDYYLAVTAAGWVAKRLDNGNSLVADSPGKLHTLIASDQGAVPVACVLSGSVEDGR
ncbi:MAG TPA: hypothetical protein VHZ03_36380 [Trebonia sp.]|jgi:hypothetical protein|nr:hypothetical protein [Trebonia sp.]